MITPKPTPSSSAQTGPGGSGTSPDLDATVTFTVDVPAASTLEAMARKALAARSRAVATTPYVSPSVGSIGIALIAVNGISLAYPPPAPMTTNITCATPATGCAISIPGVTAAIGTDEYLVTTYVSAGGAATPGNVIISSGLINVNVTSGGSNSATIGSPSAISIGGSVNAISMSSTQTPNPLVIGAPGSGTILVLAMDAAGAVIVGNALFTTPITVTPAGIVLAGPGIQGGGTYVLTGPEPAASPITFTYNGAAFSASVSASTTNATGTAVSQQLTLPLGTPTPSPSPSATPTPAPTKPGSTPSPTPSPSPTPTAPPASSLYVLNASNNTIVEYALGTNGIPASVRRVIGNGSDIACQSSLTPGSDGNGADYGFMVSGLTVDSAGNVYTASSDDFCTSKEAQLYVLSRSATTTSGIGVNSLPDSITGAGPNLGLAFDASVGAVDFTTDGPLTLVPPSATSSQSYAYAQFAYSGTSGGVASALNFVGGWGSLGTACIDSSGFTTPATGCNPSNQNVGGQTVNVGQYFQPGANNSNLPPDPAAASSSNYPLAVTGTGTVFEAVGDVPALYDAGQSAAIVSLLNSENHPGITAPAPAIADPSWIEGLDTLQYPFNGAAAMTYDPTTQRLYVLEDAPDIGGGFWTLLDLATGTPPSATNARPDFCTDAAGDDDASGNPLCADGDNHYYIVGYDLTAAPLPTACSLSVCNYPPGAKDLQPVLVIGGDQLHLPPIGDANGQYPFGFNFIPQGGLTASNGRLYLTNPVGPTCNSACVTAEGTAGLAAADAEIDVYDGTATGYFNDGATGSVFLGAFKDPNIGVPVGVVVGPQGSVVSSARVRGIHYRNRPLHRMTRTMFEHRRR